MDIYITMSTTLGISKVFILDKYFNELQKFWDTEKRLQGKTLQYLSIYSQNERRQIILFSFTRMLIRIRQTFIQC